MTMLRSALALATLLAITTACDAGDSKPTASKLCKQALPGHRIAAAQLTTVGAVRGHRIGPGLQPALHAFGSATDRSTAAWCWTNNGNASFSAYGVGPNKNSVKFGTTSGISTAPTGAPLLP